MTVAGYSFHANGAAWTVIAILALLAVLFAVVMVAIARRNR